MLSCPELAVYVLGTAIAIEKRKFFFLISKPDVQYWFIPWNTPYPYVFIQEEDSLITSLSMGFSPTTPLLISGSLLAVWQRGKHTMQSLQSRMLIRMFASEDYFVFNHWAHWHKEINIIIRDISVQFYFIWVNLKSIFSIFSFILFLSPLKSVLFSFDFAHCGQTPNGRNQQKSSTPNLAVADFITW